jgi:UDP-N-acetylmuramoyl-L-alanine---L-glutamate ligase
MRLADLTDRRVVVWGTGREGTAAVAAIAPHRPASLIAVEDKPTYVAQSAQWLAQAAPLAPLLTGQDAHEAIMNAEIVVRSPVIGETHPWVIEARQQGITITGGTALWMAQHRDATIGITGSKGKSTTSTLVHHLLEAVGRPNILGGNIGIAALTLPVADRYVLELSMYQCADLDDSPRVAAVTSLYPEHLDWSGGEEEYYTAKLNLLAHGPGRVVYPAHDQRLAARIRAFGPDLPALAVGVPETFHVAPGPGGAPWLYRAGDALFPRETLPLVGRHNEANLCVALGVLESDGVDCVALAGAIAGGLASFVGLPHRLSPIEDPSGLTFVDDSIATIPEATVHAVEAYADRPLTLILGGEDRGVDYGLLRDYLASAGVVATVIGLPDSGPRILDVLKDIPTLTGVLADDLMAAVRIARERTPAGGVVLLSPAAPSYGHFDNFEHRSRVFRQAIEDTAA